MKNSLVSLKAFLILSLLTGVIYPLGVTLIGNLVYPEKVNGSLVYRRSDASVLVGSTLLQQEFKSNPYFWGRPQEVTNLSPKNEKLLRQVEERRQKGFADEMLYASGSGLDPHIRVASARAQAERIAVERKLTPMQVNGVIDSLIEKREFGVFGEPRVNVLKLNLALDEMGSNH